MGALPESVAAGPGLFCTAGGALAVPAAGALVVADLHVGFESWQRRRGQPVPEVEVRTLAEALGALVRRHRPRTLVVAGDVKHASRDPAPGTARALRDVLRAAEDVEVVLVEGNHDGGLADLLPGAAPVATWRAPGLVVAHGHAGAERPDDAWLVVGHEHPRVRLPLGPGPAVHAPAFLVHEAARVVVLPALSPWAAGVVPGRAYHGAALQGLRPAEARVVALAEDEVWELGPYRDLLAR